MTRVATPQPVARHRIEIPTTPKAFYFVVKAWRDVVMKLRPNKAALAVLPYLEDNINREHGRAWPSDAGIASAIGKHVRTVKRGWEWMDNAGVIIRETRTRWDKNGQVTGSDRRIYLAIPEGTTFEGLDAFLSPRSEAQKSPETLGGTPKGQPHNNGRKSPETFEGTASVPLLSTVHIYDRKKVAKGNARTHAHEVIPAPFTGDVEFVRAFDRELIRACSGKTANVDIASITGQAFDAATDSDTSFMPFSWHNVSRLRKDGKEWPVTRNWFLDRARAALDAAA